MKSSPDLILTSRKTFLDCVKDAFASLVQSEAPPMFIVKSNFSAGILHSINKIKCNTGSPSYMLLFASQYSSFFKVKLHRFHFLFTKVTFLIYLKPEIPALIFQVGLN